jgi:hypothetical protein
VACGGQDATVLLPLVSLDADPGELGSVLCRLSATTCPHSEFQLENPFVSGRLVGQRTGAPHMRSQCCPFTPTAIYLGIPVGWACRAPRTMVAARFLLCRIACRAASCLDSELGYLIRALSIVLRIPHVMCCSLYPRPVLSLVHMMHVLSSTVPYLIIGLDYHCSARFPDSLSLSLGPLRVITVSNLAT